MEPFSKALTVCAVTAALYQMCGTPFLLNIVIFCSCTLLCLYAMLISGYMVPSETLYDWFYGSKEVHGSQCQTIENNNEEEFDLNQTDDQITKRLRELTGHIVRDFILSWYNTVSEDVTFVQEAFEIFEHLLKESRARVSGVDRQRLCSAVLAELLEHYINYQNAVQSVGNTAHQRSSDDDERRMQLIVISYCEKRCHPAFENVPGSEMKHLRGLAVLLLKGLLPRDYKLRETPLYVVRELVAQNVFSSLVDMMSDPLWIYKTLVRVLSDDDTTEKSETTAGSDNSTQALSTDDKGESDARAGEVESYKRNNDPVMTLPLETRTVSDGLEPENGLRPSSAASEDTLTGSQLSTSSCNSHFSDSVELDALDLASSNVNEDLPLPLTSLQTHFADETDQTNSGNNLQVPDVASNVISPMSGMTALVPGRLFYRIRVPDSVTMQEGFEGGGKYTLYRITYRTMKERIITPSTTIGSASLTGDHDPTANTNCTVQDSPVKIEVVKHQVQRRFREFLALQERLAENMVARNLIADIRGPSRMFPVPFGNMDKDYIETRRKFLQAYLREICSIPFISNSKEMREFLAYETDPRIAYVRKPDSLPRIDKIFKSAVQDLFGTTAMKFSSTLMLDDDDFDAENEQLRNIKNRMRIDSTNAAESLANKPGRVAKWRNLMLGTSPKLQTREEPPLRRQYTFDTSQTCVPTSWIDVEDAIKPLPKSPTDEMRFFRRTSGDGCDDPVSSVEENVPGEVDAARGMAEAVFRLVLHVWKLSSGVHNVAVLSLSQFVERYLVEKLTDLTSAENWTRYLSVLRDALWPEGTWDGSGGGRMTWSNAPKSSREMASKDARRALEKALPNALSSIVGEPKFKKGVEQLVESFQHVAINRHLFYYLLDLLIREVFADLTEVVAQENVFFSAVPIT